MSNSLRNLEYSLDAVSFALFLTDKISSAGDLDYPFLLNDLNRFWNDDIYRKILPEAAVITRRVSDSEWNNLEIKDVTDIKSLLLGGDNLRQHPDYGPLLTKYEWYSHKDVPTGLLEGLAKDLTKEFRDCFQLSLADSRKSFNKLRDKLRNFYDELLCQTELLSS